MMVARVVTVAFEGVEARRVDVEVQASSGAVAFVVVGLGDKAVAESRERVRAAFTGLGLALPAKRLIVNLAPADLPKEGSHYDLPIALAMMGVMGILPPDALNGWMAFGELGLDGQIAPTAGALPAAVAASELGLGLICPEASGPEAAWAGDVRILAPRSLISLLNHLRGTQVLSAPRPGPVLEGGGVADLRDVKGQEQAKRALEIAAAGGHNLLMVGPPGSGKSMLAQRLPGLLPPLSPRELLETSMIHSVAGLIAKGALTKTRPFRAPHHSASIAALTGGGARAKPGEISLAHNGVLFLDELPEFNALVAQTHHGRKPLFRIHYQHLPRPSQRLFCRRSDLLQDFGPSRPMTSGRVSSRKQPEGCHQLFGKIVEARAGASSHRCGPMLQASTTGRHQQVHQQE